jgi:ABC-type multidrug transport system fused ATPase/permease subunit
LRNLNLSIDAGTRVGICGRTGAGKSSIAAALFRLASVPEGQILLDGVDLLKLDLWTARGCGGNTMCIIPQDPVIFSGTVRFNLDPFDEYRDDELFEALASARFLGNKQSDGSSSEHRVQQQQQQQRQLDLVVDEGGGNFSQGERQLLCLARALLRRPTVLVLDEATASVDAETDQFIQRTVRARFQGTTILEIAHRLHSIMDADKIVVLEAGRVSEYGPPCELLADSDSALSGLVRATGPASERQLKAMAESSSSQRAANGGTLVC